MRGRTGCIAEGQWLTIDCYGDGEHELSPNTFPNNTGERTGPTAKETFHSASMPDLTPWGEDSSSQEVDDLLS